MYTNWVLVLNVVPLLLIITVDSKAGAGAVHCPSPLRYVVEEAVPVALIFSVVTVPFAISVVPTAFATIFVTPVFVKVISPEIVTGA